MIHAITANQPSFRSVEFTPGLNVILADRAEKSSRKDTRNGLGKSTLIEIIHFCLGARVRRGRRLAIPALEHWAFTMDMSIGGDRISVTRTIRSPNTVTVTGLGDDRPELPSTDPMGVREFTQAQWCAFLGRALFSMPPTDAPKYNPSFRSLISYFVRRGHDAFGDPFTHFRHQPTWSVQLHMALLLGLEWRHATEWQALKDRDNDLKNLRKLVDRDAVPHLGGSVGKLEAERITLTQEIEERSRALETFRVHPEYESIRDEADQLTEKLHRHTNESVASARRLNLYRQAVESEEPPSANAVEDVYEEMGVVFSEDVRRSLEEAREFYGLVVRDRRRFLRKEIARLEDRIAETDRRIRELTESRAGLLDVLATHGALEEMVRLQERHLSKCRELERVKEQIASRRQMASDERRVARDRAELVPVHKCLFAGRFAGLSARAPRRFRCRARHRERFAPLRRGFFDPRRRGSARLSRAGPVRRPPGCRRYAGLSFSLLRARTTRLCVTTADHT